MTSPNLSIITITYNNPFLKRTLESVWEQKIGHYNMEHIIVDNLSGDNTENIVKDYTNKAPYKVVYIREKDKGRYDAMNKGIKIAEGEYLSFMNAGDHFFDSDSIKNILEASQGKDIIYGNVDVVNAGNESVYCPPDRIDFDYFLNGAALPHQASIIKKKLFNKMGHYDASLNIIADWKFFLLAICKYKYSYFHVDKTIATYYFDGISSVKGNMESIDEEKNKIYNEEFSRISTRIIDNKDNKSEFKTPILFLIFNRPNVTKRVFEVIRKTKPSRLYIASDGPRKDKKGESELVKQTRDLVLDNIDWNCKIVTLFRDKNLGCGRAVSGAITWFFNQEAEGIILEDDCLPNQSFFLFCEKLLDHYRENKNIMHISGDQFIPDFNNGASYYFAKNMHCWGWASWADRWKDYRFNLVNYDEKNLEKISDNKMVQSYWLNYLKQMKDGYINTWDYQWLFKIFEKEGLCINPSKNLVSNIGFGEYSTNGFKEDNPNVNLPTFEIKEIVHPKEIRIDKKAIDYIFRIHYGINSEKVVKDNIKAIIKRYIVMIRKYI
jgi:hypothetical protein